MARLVGINHVALEVGDVDEALTSYARFFEFELRGRAGQRMAFIDMGDQFIALATAARHAQARGKFNYSLRVKALIRRSAAQAQPGRAR
ncbi:MAG TPA: VOC family protein [Solirubrobacteraceae bacterium]|nr:VOC family protein [Solirubrobacteraceae bacterium]